MSSSDVGRVIIVAGFSSGLFACSISEPHAVRKCTENCQDTPEQEGAADAAATHLSDSSRETSSSLATTNSGESHGTRANPDAGAAATSTETASEESSDQTVPDAGARSEFERKLVPVDEAMDYGYADDPVLYELSRAAGHAGVASCLCTEEDASTELLLGCALDEGRNQLWVLHLDYSVAMDCARAEVGTEALAAFAECVLDVLERQQACYLEQQGTDRCPTCVPDYEPCPSSRAIAAAYDACSPYDDERPPERTRRVKSEAETL
jgi:hypothetical protein